MLMKSLTLFWMLMLCLQVSASELDAVRRPNPLLSFIANITGVKQFALYSLITKRCDRYLATRPEQKLCHAAVEKKIALLDFDLLAGPNNQFIKTEATEPHAFIIIAFKRNLIQLLSEAKTTVYLNDVQNELTKFLTEDRTYPANLWEITLRHFPTEEAAARALAALFQDISPVKMHLLYLEKSRMQGNANFLENKELLGRVIDTVQLIMDYSGDNYQRLLYPKEVSAQLNKAIYHFYVPLYLSLALKSSGITSRYAFTAPLMMTLSYEFISSSEDYTYIYQDPASLDSAKPEDRYKLNDIFAGYYGVSFGVKSLSLMKSFSQLSSSFKQSTASGVKLLLVP